MKFVYAACPDCDSVLTSRFFRSERHNVVSFGVELSCLNCFRSICLSLSNDTLSSFDVDLDSVFFQKSSVVTFEASDDDTPF